MATVITSACTSSTCHSRFFHSRFLGYELHGCNCRCLTALYCSVVAAFGWDLAFPEAAVMSSQNLQSCLLAENAVRTGSCPKHCMLSDCIPACHLSFCGRGQLLTKGQSLKRGKDWLAILASGEQFLQCLQVFIIVSAVQRLPHQAAIFCAAVSCKNVPVQLAHMHFNLAASFAKVMLAAAFCCCDLDAV